MLEQNRTRLYDWASSLSEAGMLPALVREFQRPKFDVYTRLREEGFAAPEFISVPLREFLKDPGRHLSEINAELLYVIIEERGKPGGRPIVSAGNLARADVVKTAVHAAERAAADDEYMITVIEEAEVVYDGNISVSREGLLSGEFVRWEGKSIARSQIAPEIRIEQQPFTRLMRWSCEDIRHRSNLAGALFVIPHETEGNRVTFRPGYYEVQILRRSPEGPLTAVIRDFREWER